VRVYVQREVTTRVTKIYMLAYRRRGLPKRSHCFVAMSYFLAGFDDFLRVPTRDQVVPAQAGCCPP